MKIAKFLLAAAMTSVLSVSAVADSHGVKDDKGFTVYRSEPGKAVEMLDRAVAYMQENSSERAFAAFNNQAGKFHENDLYVFVVGIGDGVMHAHGGAPEAIVGDNVMELADAAGTKIIQAMIDKVKRDGEGSVDYVWLNRVTNKVEKKTSNVKRVGDYLVGVGFYTK